MNAWNIVSAVITLVIGYLAAKYLTEGVKRFFKREKIKEVFKKVGYLEPVIDYIGYFFKLGVYIITALIAISQLGFAQEILTLMAVILFLSIIGVMVYSLKELIPCAISGAYLMRSKIIRPGDKLSVKGFEGKVKEINILTTTLKSGDKVIIIPNSMITQRIIKKE